MKPTNSLREIVEALFGTELTEREQMNCERWVKEQIWARRIPAFKVRGKWRMTDAQLEKAIEVFTCGPSNVVEHPTLGLTPASLRRRAS